MSVRSAAGDVHTVVGIDPALRPGVVALSHGYGERGGQSSGAEVGVNVNRLLPSGPGSYEPYSSMAFMVGIRWVVEGERSLGRRVCSGSPGIDHIV